MQLRRIWLGLCLACYAAVIPGCNPSPRNSQDDRVIDVADDNPEMVAAIDKARSQLDQFWRKFDQPGPDTADFHLKVKITDANGTEHFWVGELMRENGKVFGVINNDPNIVRSVKNGQRIEIPAADISDWLYFESGKMIGNYTLRPLIKSMSPEEAQAARALLGEE